MRIFVVVSLLLAVTLIGGLLLLPRLVTWDDYRDEVTERAEAITGRSVAVEGRIDLALLPRPTVTLARATLSGDPAAPDGHVLVVDRLDLRLKALPLLGGQFEVEEVRLVRPVVEVPQVEQPGDATAALAAAGGGFVLPLAGGGPSRLSVVDGRAILSGGEAGGQRKIEAINLDLSAAGPDGPYALAGDFVIAGEPFAFTAQLGQIATEAWITLQLAVTAGPSRGEAARLSFHGLTWSNPAAPRLRGELSITGSDVRAGLAALGRALGDEAALPEGFAVRYRLAGRLEFSDRTASLDDLRLTLADTEAAGKLHVGIGPKPAIDLRLDLGQLAAPEAWPSGGDGGSLAALATLSTRIAGRIDLSVQALAYRGATVRRLRTSLILDGAGQVTIEQARATLPGQTTVGFSGGLAGHGEDAALRGALTVVTGDLRAVLGWLDLEPAVVAEGRLRSMSLASQLAVEAGTLRFSDAELRVDASRVGGTLALSLGPRPQVAGALVLDRLDLDAYWPDGDAGSLLAGLETLAGVDAAIEAHIERLSWHGLRLQDVALNGRSVGGRLTLNELSLRDASEGEARLAGELDLARETFDLTAELATARPAQLLRRLGLMPPLMLARLTGVQVSGTARGDLDAFDLDLAFESTGARLTLAGKIDRTNGAPTYDLAVDASHPDYPQLLDRLGLPRWPAENGPHPLTLTGKLSGDLSAEAAVVGSARLGAMSLTGRAGWQRGLPRPKLSVRLSAGEPSLQALAELAAVVGLAPDPSLLGKPRPGDWSAQPLALHGFDALDAEIELSGKGGVAGPGFEVLARLEQGRLLVDHLAAALWDGRLQAQASFDLARPLPFLALALDLRAVDPEKLAAWLDLPPVVAGPVDLYVEATTAGNTPRDLIRGLIGDVKVTLSDGGLSGSALAALPLRPDAPLADGGGAARAPDAVPIADLASSFTIRRGIVTIRAVPFVLGGAAARLLGTIDLLLWAADLTLSLDGGGAEGAAVGLRLVGPLDRPQILLLEPAESMPAQAP